MSIAPLRLFLFIPGDSEKKLSKTAGFSSGFSIWKTR
jgi:hypothetical protein